MEDIELDLLTTTALVEVVGDYVEAMCKLHREVERNPEGAKLGLPGNVSESAAAENAKAIIDLGKVVKAYRHWQSQHASLGDREYDAVIRELEVQRRAFLCDLLKELAFAAESSREGLAKIEDTAAKEAA